MLNLINMQDNKMQVNLEKNHQMPICCRYRVFLLQGNCTGLHQIILLFSLAFFSPQPKFVGL